jgi:hypothetical protein
MSGCFLSQVGDGSGILSPGSLMTDSQLLILPQGGRPQSAGKISEPAMRNSVLHRGKTTKFRQKQAVYFLEFIDYKVELYTNKVNDKLNVQADTINIDFILMRRILQPWPRQEKINFGTY